MMIIKIKHSQFDTMKKNPKKTTTTTVTIFKKEDITKEKNITTDFVDR